MSEGTTSSNGNGCYLITSEGERIALPRKVYAAIKRVLDARELSGSVTIQIKAGAVFGVEDRLVYR